MAMYNFKRLFKKYNKPFIKVVPGTPGYWDTEDTGKWIPPADPEPVETTGIILQLSDDDLRFDEGGTFTFEDKKILYEGEMSKGQTVIIDGEDYMIDRKKPFKLYSHFTVYYCKRVTRGGGS